MTFLGKHIPEAITLEKMDAYNKNKLILIEKYPIFKIFGPHSNISLTTKDIVTVTQQTNVP